MILEKQEWKEYKKRNIERLIGQYCSNKTIMNSKLHKFIFKNEFLKKHFIKLLMQKFKLDFRLKRKASFANLDFQITTRCTLKCEQCCSLMTFFNKETHHDETFETFKVNLNNLLKNVNKIYRFQIIGGEPLLNKDVAKIVDHAARKKQIKYLVIITNGTIIPDEELLKVCKKYKNKIFVDVSDYSCNPNIKNLKTDEVVEKFKKYNITAFKTDYPWYQRGDIKKSNRTIERLKEEFSNCWQINCPSYCDGELHTCSRSVGIKRNLDKNLRDYIKIDGEHDVSDDIIRFFIKKYIIACDYCHTRCDIKIPRGVQIERE